MTLENLNKIQTGKRVGRGIPGKDTNVKDAVENGESSGKGTVRNNETIDWGEITDKFKWWPKWSVLSALSNGKALKVS